MPDQDDMPDQDHADVIEQAPRHLDFPLLADFKPPSIRIGRRTGIAGAVAVVLAIAAVVAIIVVPKLDAPSETAAAEALVPQITSLPPRAADIAAASAPTAVMMPVTSPPLSGGKPEVLYVSDQFCPYCAVQNWALLVALGRFGTFAGVQAIRSASFEGISPLDTWSFYRASYRSDYLTFVPVETRSNVLVSKKANPADVSSYRPLQKLTAGERSVFANYDQSGSVPFTDFDGQAVEVGTLSEPTKLEHLTWSQIAADLRRPGTVAGRQILGAADYLTAEFCTLTRDSPASACPPFITGLQAIGSGGLNGGTLVPALNGISAQYGGFAGVASTVVP
jgi:hypothetical protein